MANFAHRCDNLQHGETIHRRNVAQEWLVMRVSQSMGEETLCVVRRVLEQVAHDLM